MLNVERLDMEISSPRKNNKYLGILIGIIFLLIMMNRLISSSLTIVFLTFVTLFIALPVLGNAFFRLNFAFIFWAAFFIYICSRTISLNSATIKFYLVFFSGLMLFVFMSYSGQSLFDNNGLFLIISLSVSFSVLLQFLIPSLPFFAKDGGEYGGITGKTYYVVLCSFLVISACIFSKKLNVLTRIVIILLAASAVLITGSRSNIVTIPLAVSLSFLLAARKGTRIKKLFEIIVVTFLLAFTVYFIGKSLQLSTIARVEESISRYARGLSVVSGRDVLIERAIDEFHSSPFFGIGWFGISNKYLVDGEVGSHVHNLYLQLLAETGVFGFVLFLVPALLILFSSTFFLLRKRKNDYPGRMDIFLICYSYQLYYLASSFLHATSYDPIYIMLYFVSAGYLYGATRIKKEERRVYKAL